MFKKTIDSIVNLPKLYCFSVVLIYSVFMAEFGSYFTDISVYNLFEITNTIIVIKYIGFFAAILSGILSWILFSYLYHLSALLLDGNAKFSIFLYRTGYAYLFPAVGYIFVFFYLEDPSILYDYSPEELTKYFEEIKLDIVLYVLSATYLPYYSLIVYTIRLIYNLNWWRSIVAVLTPVVLINLCTLLIRYLIQL